MAKNLVQDGNILTFLAPAGGVVSGGAYLIAAAFGVANVSAAEGKPFALSMTGVWDLPKAAGVTPAPGAALYWDNAAKAVTTTVAGNVLVGVHAGQAAAVAGAATVPVRLG